jgi:pyruvate-formate lyase-activating enzyme
MLAGSFFIMKKALTYTVVAGTRECPNNCGICISKMTPRYGPEYETPLIDWQKFEKATQIAVNYNSRYFLITSKGEATLQPAQVTEYLHRVEGKPFDRRELQTEGSTIAHGGKLYDEFLNVWQAHGLDVVAVSIYHQDKLKNHEVFRSKNEPYEIRDLITQIRKHDMNVRISCVMLKGYVDSLERISELISFCKTNGVFQLTLRRADRPVNSLDGKVARFVDENKANSLTFENELMNFLNSQGTLCDVLPHGAMVYEVDGQNVAVSSGLGRVNTSDDCIASKPSEDELRQLIFIPPNMLTTRWDNIFGGRIL